jgi:hypothetical protein
LLFILRVNFACKNPDSPTRIPQSGSGSETLPKKSDACNALLLGNKTCV